MPLGIQVIASPWREDLVLAVGLFLQEALGEFPRPNI
jgi:Asp-tRNA(Asn)/Glu-tRNA(Gln) amidotransferase A subunit family amidase